MNLRLTISPRVVTTLLVVISIMLLLASVAVSCWTLYGNGDEFWFVVRIFDFDAKNNLPHAYKALLLFMCSLALFWIACERKMSGGASLWLWRGLAWIFLLLSIDQEIQIHQQLVAPLMARIKGVDPETTPDAKVYWLLPYMLFTGGFTAIYFRFWWRLPKTVRVLFAIGGVCYISGVAVLEKIANNYSMSHPDPDMIYLLMTNISEWLQMVGSIIFLRALLDFNASNNHETLLVLEKPATSP